MKWRFVILSKAKHDPIQSTILAFLQQNPNPSDKQVHKLADSLEMDPSELEEKVYEILGSFASSGRAKSKGITEKDVDAKELAMGVKVEMEHTTSPIMAKRIALDHLSELKDYYSRLKKMESKKE